MTNPGKIFFLFIKEINYPSALDNSKKSYIIYFVIFEVWLSLVERYVRDVEAAGSSPVTSTNEKAQKHRNIGSFLSFYFFGIFLILP